VQTGQGRSGGGLVEPLPASSSTLAKAVARFPTRAAASSLHRSEGFHRIKEDEGERKAWWYAGSGLRKAGCGFAGRKKLHRKMRKD